MVVLYQETGAANVTDEERVAFSNMSMIASHLIDGDVSLALEYVMVMVVMMMVQVVVQVCRCT